MMMKQALALALALGWAAAAQAQAPAEDARAQVPATVKTERAVPHHAPETALVVSAADDGSTLTIEGAREPRTLTVAEGAREVVKGFKGGDKVRVVIDESGRVIAARGPGYGGRRK